MWAHSSVNLLDKVIYKTFWKAEISMFDIVILHEDFNFQSKKVFKFFKFTILLIILLL